MTGLDPRSRRALGRALTRLATATVAESIGQETAPTHLDFETARIGFTGAPGAGKSTLISQFAKRRLVACRDQGGVAVIGIDPTSPLSGGAILGDRIRMDNVANEPDLYIRSLSSRAAHDGLADNISDLLNAVESYGFREILLETVGIGQAEHAVRHAVDTLVMVLQPNAGDAIQAMKSGILELADIYVINKADLPGAARTAAEIRGIVQRHRGEGQWLPPVLKVIQDRPEDLAALDDVVNEHLAWSSRWHDSAEIRRQRRRYHVQSLIARRVSELLADAPELLEKVSVRDSYLRTVQALAEDGQLLAKTRVNTPDGKG
jgi:LAO/AO transport system kinase